MDSGLNSVSKWTDRVVDSIIANPSTSTIAAFRQQPLANKLSALEEGLVQPRKDNTPDTVAAIVQELVKRGAILPREAGPIYSDLMIRVHRYNSTNVQSNLNVLLGDVRAAQSEVIRRSDLGELSNQAILNNFLAALPPVVPMGQQNYEAFKQSLRLMVNEAPNVTLYRSGPDTMLQLNVRGVNTVNLGSAFSNLHNLWGVMLEGEMVPGGISSKLSSNTRVLMLFLAPFTNESTFTPDTFVSQLMRLYRDTVAASIERPQETEREVEETVRDFGGDLVDIARTMSYLLKNKEAVLENPRTLSPRQLGVLRYVQESLTDRIDRNGENPEEALVNLLFSFAPSYFESNGPFIRRLVSYLEVALRNSPNYFREIYSNKYWTPPASFWTQNYGDFFVEREMEEERRKVLSRQSGGDWDDETRLPAVEPELDWDDADFNTALSPSLAAPSSVRSAPASVPYTVGSSGLTSPSSASYRPNYGASFVKAVLPQAAAALGNAVGESLYPSLGPFLAPAASLAADRLLNMSRRQKQNAKRRRDRRSRRVAENVYPLPHSPAPPSVASSLSSGTTVYGPLPGASSVRNVLMTPEGYSESESTQFGLGAFSHLRPKRGLY